MKENWKEQYVGYRKWEKTRQDISSKKKVRKRKRIWGSIIAKKKKEGGGGGVSQGQTWVGVAASWLSRRHASNSSSSSRRRWRGRILNEPSISGHHPQTNVTDKNGAHETLLNCMLDNSVERGFGVGKTSLSYEKPWGVFFFFFWQTKKQMNLFQFNIVISEN